jgi:acyl-coenzyme A thioesterase PaaI-like protein
MIGHDDSPPPEGEGWQPLQAGWFETLGGPMYQTTQGREPEEPLRIGFRVMEPHCNMGGTCHGGMIATFLDMALGLSIHRATDAGGPTMSMTIDFLGPGLPGDWIESRTRFVHSTYRTGYCDVIAAGPRGPVARANGIWRLVRPKDA